MPQPRIIIVGGGFGGLAAAKALHKAPAEVVLIDRTNHHLFQPLLYQVATSVLTPGQIGSPIRTILRRQKNTIVLMGEVTAVDKDQKSVTVHDADREVTVPYDYLILATGSFWIVDMWFLSDLFEGIYQVGRWPIGIYPVWLRYSMTYLVPIGFAVTVPAQALTDRLHWETVVIALAFAAVVAGVTRWFWRFGLRRYSGASAFPRYGR